MRVRCILCLLLLFGLVVGAAAQTSVADAAKAKSSQKKAKRVITDDDLPPSSSKDAAPAPAPTASESAAAPSAESKKVEGKKAEAGAKDAAPAAPESEEVQVARDTVKARQTRMEWMNGQIKQLEDKLASEPNPDKAETLAQQLQNLRQNAGILTQQRDDAQKVIDQAKKKPPE